MNNILILSEDRRQQPGQQILNTVVVRLGGLFVLLITVGRWSDVVHVLICFIGEAACLLPSQDLLEAIYQVSTNNGLYLVMSLFDPHIIH